MMKSGAAATGRGILGQAEGASGIEVGGSARSGKRMRYSHPLRCHVRLRGGG
jgi:hypothetical protein